MKKTDKSELRVDHAEKDRLMNIAERRGQTISDVVRDALAGELGSAPQSYPKWPGFVALGALGLAVCSFYWASVRPMTGINVDRPVIMSTVTLNEGKRFVAPMNFILTTQVAHRDGFSQTYTFNADGKTFETRHDVVEKSQGIYVLKIFICHKTQAACESIDQADIILSPPSVEARVGSAQFFDDSGQVFYAEVRGSKIPKPVAPIDS